MTLNMGDKGIMREKEIRRRLRDRVSAMADLTGHPERKDFVDTWYGRMERRTQLSNRFKWTYFILLTLNALAAASVPALIAAAGSSHNHAATITRFTAAALGVGIAVTTSVLGVVQVGARWQVYRIYSQAMEDAAWTYVNNSVTATATAYSTFVNAVDAARRNYEREYLKDVVAPDPKSSPGSNT